MKAGTGDLVVRTARGERTVRLDEVLGPEGAETAARDANAWVKALRHAAVDGLPLRDRFTHRGDSLWWFAELFLHKRRVVLAAHEAALALETLAASDRLDRVRVICDDAVVHCIARRFGEARGIAVETRTGSVKAARFRGRAKALFHTAAAVLDRTRPYRHPPVSSRPAVAAFVHSAFWRRDSDEETYIGPVLSAIEARVGPGSLQLVGLGPRTNFRVRHWTHRLSEFGDPAARDLPFAPIESFARWSDLAPSFTVWRRRSEMFEALASSPDVRRLAIVRDLDAWAVIESELEGIAELQFPWSARAMDEAGAALDRLEPGAVVTYAEAGGWGRALMLEARRRGIPSAGLQHGFIYRHWLNYLHEPDEMRPSTGNPADAGFPRPDLTLLFDEFAAEHLTSAGNFPPAALRVTGSPRLDAFAEAAATLTEAGRQRLLAEVGVAPGQHLVLVAAKHGQMGGTFAALVRAVAGRPDVRLVVKPHPAESPAAYAADAAGAGNVTIAPPSADLARLTSLARLIVTANSTAAIEAMVVDVPALIVNLPNNLTPFVQAGAFAGADTDGLGEALTRLLYDEESRARLAAARQAFMGRYRIVADGQAAARSAETILHLALASARPPDGLR